MTILTSFKRMLRFNEPPSTYEPLYWGNIIRELNNFALTESQLYDIGWSTGTYDDAQHGPFGNAAITSASHFNAGSQTFTVSAASGTTNAVPWVIAVNTVLNIEPGSSNQEFVLVTAVSGTSITASFVHAHDGSSTPFAIQVPVFGPQMWDIMNRLIAALISGGKLGK